MKLFTCTHCGQPVFFENYLCLKCHAPLGFDPIQMELVALQQTEKGYALYAQSGETHTEQYKYCSNKQHNICNWLLPNNSNDEFCVACNLNHTIPDLSVLGNLEKWGHLEVAKHRLVYSLLRFKLPVVSKYQDENKGLAFDFMADDDASNNRLLTGHANGWITLNIEEADDVARAMARNQMNEVYRTLLGHFRHEVGHYYWDQLIKDTARLDGFRKLFGDESMDYSEALKKHYAKTDSEEWRGQFISAYASAHPWEDWAETWAHYLHIVDTLETAYSFGLNVKPRLPETDTEMSARLNIDAYTTKSFDNIINRWIPLSFVMNSLNRSMGMKDIYPFVINEAVIEKLKFIHETIKEVKDNV